MPPIAGIIIDGRRIAHPRQVVEEPAAPGTRLCFSVDDPGDRALLSGYQPGLPYIVDVAWRDEGLQEQVRMVGAALVARDDGPGRLRIACVGRRTVLVDELALERRTGEPG